MTLENKIDKIYELLREQRAKEKKQTWVSVRFVQKLTGWSKEDLRFARRDMDIKTKREDGKYLYLLESIPDQFIKKVL